MRNKLCFLVLLILQFGYAQQYDSVVIEKDSIDSNNQVYKVGNVYVFDYEIIKNGISKKLKTNSNDGFELVNKTSDSVGVAKIHLLVRPSIDSPRTNENQTQISYMQGPEFGSFSSTGVVDNSSNVWIHPIRSGFFESLETCPFPFVKKPLSIGLEWQDAMSIGEGWGNQLWGEWSGQLLLSYHYKITGKESITTDLGVIECYIIESKADSKLGTTTLKSYFSDVYGFLRFEYELLTGLKVTMWVVDFMENKAFNDTMTFFKTKEYLKQ
ncbi:hypothetical protein [Flavobacterium orientale]|uniref:Uncharacterized protein n=1 Tax=Flavobacterium orientale TaxID=1756020 RepID=A0A917D9H5_9FLAO|nr:hypothetical protein [Flavobacterium orientale]GGD15511.1 hypothetical protein GCM10011343_03060 [Flavobacterium orientale]